MSNHLSPSKWLAASRYGVYVMTVCAFILLPACIQTTQDVASTDSTATKDTATGTTKPLIQLPIEVLGAEGTQTSVTLNLSASEALNAKSLWLQTHNVRYPEKASVSINGGAWTALNNNNAKMIGTSQIYGGIGGSYATLKMTLPINDGVLQAGDNTVAFRFNTSNGITVGYRLIGLNFLDSANNKLIADSNFTEADPATFTAPSTQASDIAAGRDLWSNAPLMKNYLAGAPSIIARCADCHTVTGADLKYFGYSNKAIIERAKFHGLNDAQGEQIASYIRSLRVKAVGRPWNPPYQPGPGITAKPNDEWAAGAGIQNVLEDDLDTIKALFPNGPKREVLMEGDTNNFKRFSAHDTPLAFQLPDWNHWLPEVHPYDAFGKTWFEGTTNFKRYKIIRSQFEGKTEAQIKNIYATSRPNNGAAGVGEPTGYFAMRDWAGTARSPAVETFMNGQITNAQDAKKIYSLALWKIVKMFETQEEFGLTSMGPEVRNAQWYGFDEKYALPRSWVGIDRTVFDVSPFIQRMPDTITGSASGDNAFNHDYLGNSWYQLQLILNAGHRLGYEHRVIDWGYAYGFMQSSSRKTQFGQTGRTVVWAIKSTDEADNGNGPNRADGWSNRRISLGSLGLYNDFVWSKFWVTESTPDSRALLSLLAQVRLEKNASWLPVQFQKNLATGLPLTPWEDGSYFDPPTRILGTSPDPNDPNLVGIDAFNLDVRSTAASVDRFLPQALNYQLFEPALQNGYVAWAKAMWPGLDANGVARNNWDKYSVARAGAAPTKPVVTAGATASAVNISWTNAGATSYNVKRSDSPTGPFLTIAYFRTGGSYVENVPLPGTARTYYYRISANSASGESPDSDYAAIAR